VNLLPQVDAASDIKDDEGSDCSEGSQDEFPPPACEDDGESEVLDEVTKEEPRTKKGKKTKVSRKDV
jgi:hypothetical protein